MTYMIYIYLGVAFVLAGGGWFIGYLFGERSGWRDGEQAGYWNGVRDTFVTTRENDANRRLREQIHTHLEIMDADD